MLKLFYASEFGKGKKNMEVPNVCTATTVYQYNSTAVLYVPCTLYSLVVHKTYLYRY